MTCQISLGADDDFILTTPSGRRLSVPNSPHATRMLWHILWNATAQQTTNELARYPTQRELDKFLKEKAPELRAKEAAARLAEKSEALGVDLAELDFSL